jgi:hypothetical protein
VPPSLDYIFNGHINYYTPPFPNFAADNMFPENVLREIAEKILFPLSKIKQIVQKVVTAFYEKINTERYNSVTKIHMVLLPQHCLSF